MRAVVRLPGPLRWSWDAGAQPCPAPRIPVIRNVNVGVAEQRTLAARVADSVAVMIGSWCVIGSQSALPALQVTFSVNGPVKHWDPWPFILLHLALSVQAARAAPTIRMRQDRQAAKGCMMAGESFRVNREAEDVIRAIITPLARQERVMLYILARGNPWRRIARRGIQAPLSRKAPAGRIRRRGWRSCGACQHSHVSTAGCHDARIG
jgi:uncharacterized membrane protein